MERSVDPSVCKYEKRGKLAQTYTTEGTMLKCLGIKVSKYTSTISSLSNNHKKNAI
jgi:hypothetical protein